MNKNIPLFVLLGATLALSVVGAVAAPTNAPKMAPVAGCDSKRFLNHFDMIPGKEFAGFGGVNRRSLLKRKGAVVDYARNYALIPGSANPEDGDLRFVQISMFGSGDPLVAVSRVMWDNPNGKVSTLRFYYGYADGTPTMRTAASGVFPYQIGKSDYADLPRRGTTIKIMEASGQSQMAAYSYNSAKNRFYKTG